MASLGMPVSETDAWPVAIDSFDIGAVLGGVPATITSGVLIDKGEDPPSERLAALAVHFSPAFRVLLTRLLFAAGTVIETVPL